MANFTQTQLEFFKEKNYAIIAVPNNNNDYPHLTPVWNNYYKDKVYVITTTDSAKYRYISKGSNKLGLSILPADGFPYLSITGNATIRRSEEFDEFEKIIRSIVNKYIPKDKAEERINGILAAGNRILIEIEPVNVFGSVK